MGEALGMIETRGLIAMIEAALIFEAGTNSRFEKMIVVTCDPEQKVARFAKRAGIDEAAARAEVERRTNGIGLKREIEIGDIVGR